MVTQPGGGAGGAGGAGGTGIIISGTLTNTGMIVGGAGGAGGAEYSGQGLSLGGFGGSGGAGGAGSILSGIILSLSNTGTIIGGVGGAGRAVTGNSLYGGVGGSDGVGARLSGTLINSGAIAGADGGAGGAGAYGRPSGAGGAGAVGVSLSAGSVVNFGTIAGGAGGLGASATGFIGVAGVGGAGITLSGNLANSGTIAGGRGGDEGAGHYSRYRVSQYQDAGAGGIGVNLTGGGSLINNAVIIGGSGGDSHSDDGDGGPGGTGAAITGNLTNNGTIQGGAGGDSSGSGSPQVHAGGAGVSITGNLTNHGTIAGGEGGSFGSFGGGIGGDGAALSDGSLTNDGVIVGGIGGLGDHGSRQIGGSGVVLFLRANGGGITNGSLGNPTALIQGGYGIRIYDLGNLGVANVTNFGVVTGTQAIGIVLLGSGTIVNAGAISGYTQGIGFVSAAYATVIDSGTITSTGTTDVAIAFSNYSNRLVLQQGFYIDGKVIGGAGTDVLELDGNAGAPLTVDYDALRLTNFDDVLFAAGNYNTLRVSNIGTLGVTISWFDATSETIDLTSIGTDGQITNNDTISHRVTVTGSLGSVTLQLDATAGAALTTASDGATGTQLIACYLRGTLIRTERGGVPIEELAIGDLVMTLSGMAKPLKWIGRRSYDPRFVAGSPGVLPIRVMAGALADGLPARDLWLSPEHALYLDGLLVPARLLINGATIRRQGTATSAIEYFHLELDGHDVVFAEGAPAETFVDCDNRAMFQNAGEFAALYPDDTPAPWQFCAPRVGQGSTELTAIRRELLARAAALGRLTTDPGLHLIADGAPLAAKEVAGQVHRFALSAGCRQVALASRRAVPAETAAGSSDERRLGIAIERIVLSGTEMQLAIGPDFPALRNGFHANEGSHRWSDVFAPIAPELLAAVSGDVTVEVHIAATELHYPIDPLVAGATAPVAQERSRRAAG